MTYHRIDPPPAALLGSNAAVPEARTVIAEVRSDASITFDPSAAPGFLVLPNIAFGALIQWRVDMSWSEAQQVQLWLLGGPAGGLFATREEALKDFFENLEAGTPPVQFLDYVGTYLTTNLSHASYTLVLGMRVPTQRDIYQSTFQSALNTLLAGPAGWPAELVSFLKMMLNQPSSCEEFLTLARNVDDLSRHGPPLIATLIT
jgi:hypothetical protein